MEDFIKAAASKLGLAESVTKNATGTVLGFIKNGLGDQFSAVTEKLPGAEKLADESSAEGEASGGVLGGIAGAASSILGGNAGEGLELMGLLQKAGLSTEQGGSLVTMLIQWIREKVGEGVIEQITSKLPMLKTLMG